MQAIFGAGKNGRILLTAARSQGITISCFVDDFSAEKEVCGIPVRRVHEVEPARTEVHISLFQNNEGRLCSAALKSNLRKQGFATVHTFEQTFQQWPGIGKAFADTEYLWMRRETSLTLDRKKIASVEPLFAEDKSRTLFRRIVAFRESLSPSHYPMPEESLQYFPGDIPLFTTMHELRFIDGGAFTGDSVIDAVETFRRLGKTVRAVASFEPDEKNRVRLRSRLAALKESIPEAMFSIYPCALWSGYDMLNFHHASQGSASMLSAASAAEAVRIPAVSIDEAVFGIGPNYIKLDIEGAETEALQGATQTIAVYRPALAVCLYHRPQDLWEIPLQIHSLCADYNMYLRLYGHMGIELVLYCLPKSGARKWRQNPLLVRHDACPQEEQR